ncbi:MAG TPA: phosphoesterase [Desulfobacteraceae bacterium]|nr:phosphoesterase [Desulfobacteraceae bacterium]
MKNFSFIHASDLHLDSPFKGITAQSTVIKDTLRSATFDTFNALVQLCIDKEVQFMVVAGDVYDGADRSLRAQLKFLDGLKRLSENNIRSFVAHGNHDPLTGWSSTIEWPGQVHIFGSGRVETTIFEIDGEPTVSVSGISYLKRNERHNLARKFQAINPELFQVGVLHCNCGGDPNHGAYAPCSLDDLTGIGFNYWALGHVHQKKILSTNPYVVYPGNPQGLNIREKGERGCYLVTVSSDGHVDLEFCPLDSVRWLSADICIDEISSIDALDRTIAQTTNMLAEQACGRPVICRILLTGRGPLYNELRREPVVTGLLERSRDPGLWEDAFVWVQDIEMNCRPEVDLEKRREINDFLGQILQVSKEIRELVHNNKDDYQTLKDSIMPALRELYDDRRAAKVLGEVSLDELTKILYDAELLCVDFLEATE